jgi:hypothetical protein
MITIIYDPENGEVVQDAKTEAWARQIISLSGDVEITIGIELMITAIRAVGIVEFPHKWNEVVFKFRDTILKLDEFWNIPDGFPKDFGDYDIDYLCTLFKNRTKILEARNSNK